MLFFFPVCISNMRWNNIFLYLWASETVKTFVSHPSRLTMYIYVFIYIYFFLHMTEKTMRFYSTPPRSPTPLMTSSLSAGSWWIPRHFGTRAVNDEVPRQVAGEDECQKTPEALCQRRRGAPGVPAQHRQRLRAGDYSGRAASERVCVCVYVC